MRVALHLDRSSCEVVGVWYELEDDGLACIYQEELSTSHLLGVEVMADRSPLLTWDEYWDRLAARPLFLDWWEVVEVDDESYPSDLLYDLRSCHPRAVVGGVAVPIITSVAADLKVPSRALSVHPTAVEGGLSNV